MRNLPRCAVCVPVVAMSARLLAQLGLDGLALGLVARLVEQGKHVFLVGLDTWLVERVHIEDVAAHAASLLKEVDELAQVLLLEGRHGDEQVGHATVTCLPAMKLRPSRLALSSGITTEWAGSPTLITVS